MMVTFTVVMLTCRVEVVVLPVVLVEVRVVPLEVETDDFELDWLDSVFVVEGAGVCPVPSAKYPTERTRMRMRVRVATPVMTKLRLFSMISKGRQSSAPGSYNDYGPTHCGGVKLTVVVVASRGNQEKGAAMVARVENGGIEDGIPADHCPGRTGVRGADSSLCVDVVEDD